MIKLNEKSFSLLKQCLERHNQSLIPTIESKDVDDYSADFYNKLRNAVGDEFCAKGLQPDDEPNQYGLELEDLIDEIGHLFMWREEV